MNENPTQPDPDLHPNAKAMTPVSVSIMAALDAYWTEHPDPMGTFHLWQTGAVALTLRTDPETGRLIVAAVSLLVDPEPAPEQQSDAPGIGNYL